MPHLQISAAEPKVDIHKTSTETKHPGTSVQNYKILWCKQELHMWEGKMQIPHPSPKLLASILTCRHKYTQDYSRLPNIKSTWDGEIYCLDPWPPGCIYSITFVFLLVLAWPLVLEQPTLYWCTHLEQKNWQLVSLCVVSAGGCLTVCGGTTFSGHRCWPSTLTVWTAHSEQGMQLNTFVTAILYSPSDKTFHSREFACMNLVVHG